MDEILLSDGSEKALDLGSVVDKLTISDNISSNVDSATQVTDRIKGWIQELQRQKQGLPKTKEKLGKAIAKMCYFDSCFPCKNIITRLEEDKFIISASQTSIKLNRNAFDRLNLSNYQSFEENRCLAKSSGGYYSSYGQDNSTLKTPSVEEQENMGYDRVIGWLHQQERNNNITYKKDAFVSQVKQLCEFKIYVSSNVVIEYLQNIGLFEVSEDYESIVYNDI